MKQNKPVLHFTVMNSAGKRLYICNQAYYARLDKTAGCQHRVSSGIV
jgi:hypothetical protein